MPKVDPLSELLGANEISLLSPSGHESEGSVIVYCSTRELRAGDAAAASVAVRFYCSFRIPWLRAGGP